MSARLHNKYQDVNAVLPVCLLTIVSGCLIHANLPPTSIFFYPTMHRRLLKYRMTSEN